MARGDKRQVKSNIHKRGKADEAVSERRRYISVIRNSISKRRSHPNPKLVDNELDNLAGSLGEQWSVSASSSSAGMAQKLAKLPRLEIPGSHQPAAVVAAAVIRRHPTVLRAGPPTRETSITTTPEQHRCKELFLDPAPLAPCPTSSVNPSPALQKEKAPSSPLHRPPTSPSRPPPPPQQPKHLPKATAAAAAADAELAALKQEISALYYHSSILIPPYLLDRLKQLDLIEDKRDFTFDFDFDFDFDFGLGLDLAPSASMEMMKLERIRCFLPVLKRVIDLVSEMAAR